MISTHISLDGQANDHDRTAGEDSNGLLIRIHGNPRLPILIYLPGLHGDWSLVSSFRAAVRDRLCFVEFTYPKTTVWSLTDYARAIQSALRKYGITKGWLLGESFGSQVAWALIDLSASAKEPFQPQGLILAGGFVKHPTIWGVKLVKTVWDHIPLLCLKKFLVLYTFYARFRHRHAPETLASVAEFVGRRDEPDRLACGHRLALIARNDPSSIARNFKLPVYYLAGVVDPLVPFPVVRLWLRRNCPAYRGGVTYWSADHNVLATAPKESAQQVLSWIEGDRL